MGGKSKKPVEPGSTQESGFNITLMGAAMSGKTTIIKKVLFNQCIKTYEPTLSDLHSKRIEVDGVARHFAFQDSSAIDESFRKTLISKSNAIIVVCDLTTAGTLVDVEDILKFTAKCMEQEEHNGFVARPKKLVYLLGNKKDLVDERVIKEKELEAVAEKFPTCETVVREISALHDESLEVIDECLKELSRRHVEWWAIHSVKISKCVIC